MSGAAGIATADEAEPSRGAHPFYSTSTRAASGPARVARFANWTLVRVAYGSRFRGSRLASSRYARSRLRRFGIRRGPNAMTSTVHPSVHAPRLLSLDVARGITIAFMIMVNNNGGRGSWHFMNHAAWNGLTATDLVFPTFVFVMGLSVVYAIESRLARGATRSQLVRHTVQRAVILCLLGIVVNSFPFFELEHMRFYGVLQRIAVCYLAVSLLYLWNRRAVPMIVALVVALGGYWVLLRLVPVPGA